MDPQQAYKYYILVKKHFTNEKYDVFSDEKVSLFRISHDVRTSKLSSFFHLISKKFTDPKELVAYYAASYAYGTNIFNVQEGLESYATWTKRSQSITQVFIDDLSNIIKEVEDTGVESDDIFEYHGEFPLILEMFLAKRITIETMKILNDYYDNFIDEWLSVSVISTILDTELKRILKLKNFVKYDKNRIEPIYQSFIEELLPNGIDTALNNTGEVFHL